MTTTPLMERISSKDDDVEYQLDEIRRHVHGEQAAIQKRFLQGESLPGLMKGLSDIAEDSIQAAFYVAQQQIKKSIPAPKGSLIIAAMGKFGGREINFYSDLDLIYLYECEGDQEYYSRLLIKLMNALTVFTREGYAFKIDMDLRPSGHSGALLSTLDSFAKYHQESGQTWERQALLRARPLLLPLFQADPAFMEKVTSLFTDIAYRPEPSPEIGPEIFRLRERMQKENSGEKKGQYNLKSGYGGLVDIEFAVQFLQLRHGYRQECLRTPSTLDALHELSQANIIDQATARELEEAYLFYRQLEAHLRINLEQATDTLRYPSPVFDQISEKMVTSNQLNVQLEHTRQRVRHMYAEILNHGEPS